MSDFSVLLSGIIHQKGYSIRGIAARLGMPATTLTKLCNGTRSPRHHFDKIEELCDFLMLTPDQQRSLYTAYEKETLGAGVWAARRSIQALAENMRGELPMGQRVVAFGALPAFSVTEKPADVYAALYTFIEEAVPGRTLDMVLLPEDAAVLNILCSAVKNYPLKVRHIMALTTSDSTTGAVSSHNIDMIRRVMPLVLGRSGRDASYQPYYYYERAQAAGQNFFSFPVVLISSQGVLLCARDFSRAVYSAQEELHRYCRKLFGWQLASCRPLISSERTPRGQLEHFERLMDSAGPGSELMSLSWQPCLLWAASEAQIRAFLPEALAFREEYLALYLPYHRRIAARRHPVFIFTQAGVLDFLHSGLLRELPDGLLPQGVPVPVRRALMRRLLDAARSGEACLYLTREERFPLAKGAYFGSYGGDTVWVAALDYENGNGISFVEELSTNWGALDFLEHLEESNLVLSGEQTRRVMEELLERELPLSVSGPPPAEASSAAAAPQPGG